MAPDLKEYDEEQVRLMEEMCIVVDENDKRVGADSKKTCRFKSEKGRQTEDAHRSSQAIL